MASLASIFRALRGSRAGNATLLVALALPAMIGGAGFAVDTAQWYLWKNELQHSVDQAAYAGAWALARPESAANYSTRAKQEYSANLSKTTDFASAPAISIADYAGGNQNSVVVSATATKALPFSSFLTGNAATIRVSAQASFKPGSSYQACLVALSKTGTNLDIGGNATVKAQCGLAALSCSDNAVVIDPSAQVTTDSIVACGTVSVPAQNEGVVTEKVTTLTDPFSDLTPPDNTTPQSYNCTGKGTNKQASLAPGTYSGLVVKCTTTLSSGIYVIDGGDLDLSANYNVTGTNVIFVLRNGARLKLGGSGNGNRITLTPMTASDYQGTPYAAEADRLAGMLVFEDRNNNAPNPGHQLNGNSNSLIEGMIYLPDGNLTVNGTANVSAQCLQVSAYTIKISGNATLETLCPTSATNSIGTGLADVRMVA